MSEIRNELVSLIAAECVNMDDVQNLLKDLFGKTIENMLKSGREDCGRNVTGSEAEKNKSIGVSLIQKPVAGSSHRGSRRPLGEPDTRTSGKYRMTAGNIEDKIIAMYAKGMSDCEIGDCLRDIYGIDTTADIIGKVTDKIIPDAVLWKNRPLERIYPVVFPDRIYINTVKDGSVVRKCVGSLLGIGMDGRKDILGIWITENDQAFFWTEVLKNIKNRGVRDILIACHDGIPGFTAAIESVFPKTEQQLCIIHKLRDAAKYFPDRDLKEAMADLKLVWGAMSLAEADLLYNEFRKKWGGKYSQIINYWDVNRNELTACFKYPREMRRLIYTINTAEGFHRMLRKFTKHKAVYPDDDSVLKSVYLSILEITRKWDKPVLDWETIIGQLVIFFEDRLVA